MILAYATSRHRALDADFGMCICYSQVESAKGVKAADRGGTSDPYVRVSIQRSGDKKLVAGPMQTRVIDKTLNPAWKQVSDSFHSKATYCKHGEELSIP